MADLFLPLLQMRAHMLGRPPLSSLGSEASEGSVGTSPPAPLSPLLHPHSQLYVNQLAAINLHLQQKRLLSAGGAVESKSAEQEEALDLTTATPAGPSPPSQEVPVFSFNVGSGAGAESSSPAAPAAPARPASRSSRSSASSPGHKRSRSSSPHSELRFTEEEEDEEVFEAAPLPPVEAAAPPPVRPRPAPLLLPPSSPFTTAFPPFSPGLGFSPGPRWTPVLDPASPFLPPASPFAPSSPFSAHPALQNSVFRFPVAAPAPLPGFPAFPGGVGTQGSN